MAYNDWDEQNRIFLYSYDPESIASKLVITFFVTDVILGTLIYFAGGLKINRWLLHVYYCYSLSGSVLTVLLASATIGLSAQGWFTLNTSVLNLIIGALTIMGCFVTIALQVYFVYLLRKEIADRLKNSFMNKGVEIEHPIQIDEELGSSPKEGQKEKG